MTRQVTIRQLERETSKTLKEVDVEGSLIVTRNGEPSYVLSRHKDNDTTDNDTTKEIKGVNDTTSNLDKDGLPIKIQPDTMLNFNRKIGSAAEVRVVGKVATTSSHLEEVATKKEDEVATMVNKFPNIINSPADVKAVEKKKLEKGIELCECGVRKDLCKEHMFK